MSVYVDDYFAGFGRMKMCHMIADSHQELIIAAKQIGVSPKWIQDEGTWKEHFDICKSKRILAIENGARAISFIQLGTLLAKRRIESKNEGH